MRAPPTRRNCLLRYSTSLRRCVKMPGGSRRSWSVYWRRTAAVWRQLKLLQQQVAWRLLRMGMLVVWQQMALPGCCQLVLLL